MGRIFVLMGKSASGKDAIYKRLLDRSDLGLKRVVLYTTRPIRQKEVDGVEYHFCDEEEEARLTEAGKVIEKRVYNTRLGRWAYFTADDGQIDINSSDYLMIATLEAYIKLRDYYSKELVLPIYIETEDSIRLERAIRRERKQAAPRYDEVCRRFLTDSEDFSSDKLEAAGVSIIFKNEGELEDVVDSIADYMKGALNGNKDQ